MAVLGGIGLLSVFGPLILTGVLKLHDSLEYGLRYVVINRELTNGLLYLIVPGSLLIYGWKELVIRNLK